MLGFFSNKSDHPLANFKSAQKLLDDLPKTDAVEVLQEFAHWIEALFDPANEFRIDHQFAILRMLDEAAHPHLRKVIHSYFAVVPPSEFQEKRLWSAMNDYSNFCAMGYLDLTIGMQQGEKGSAGIKPGVALICARGIYAVFGRLESAAVRYEQINPQSWAHLAQFYACAEAEKCLDEQITLYAGLGVSTSVRRIFAGVLMWYTAGVGSLRPLDLHIAKRLSIYLSKSLSVTAQCREDSMFAFDLVSSSAPLRVKESGTMYPPSVRFMSIGETSAQLASILKTLGKNLVPAELNLGVAYAAEEVAEVVGRLAAYSETRQSVRRPPRRTIKMNLSVLNGFFNLLEETNVDLNLNDPISENWEVEDISANGLRCVLPEGRVSNVKIGMLVGLQSEKAMHWGVGIVRRLRRDKHNNLHVGIKILSNKVVSVVLRGYDGANTDADCSALLLNGSGADHGESLVLMKSDTFSINRSPTMTLGEQRYLLLPLGLEEKGLDFDMVRYRKMVQDNSSEEAY